LQHLTLITKSLGYIDTLWFHNLHSQR